MSIEPPANEFSLPQHVQSSAANAMAPADLQGSLAARFLSFYEGQRHLTPKLTGAVKRPVQRVVRPRPLFGEGVAGALIEPTSLFQPQTRL